MRLLNQSESGQVTSKKMGVFLGKWACLNKDDILQRYTKFIRKPRIQRARHYHDPMRDRVRLLNEGFRHVLRADLILQITKLRQE